MLTVRTLDTGGVQRGISLRPSQLRYTTLYPGGFGFCSFDLPGRRLGQEYPDIGYLYRCQVYDGLSLVFDGEIRVIEERASSDPGHGITAFGYGVVAGDDTYNRVWIDERLGNWTFLQDWNIASGGYNPPMFEHRFNAMELYLQAKLNATFANGDYAVLHYELPKNAGGTYVDENIEEIFFYYSTGIASGTWTLDLYDQTNAGRCRTAAGGGGVEWTVVATAGSTGVTVYPPVAASCKAITFRLTAGAANTPGNTAIFARIASILVKTTSGTVYADDIAKHILSSKLDESGIGLSTSQVLINSGSTFALNPQYLADKDLTCREVLDWICSFGEHNDKELAWGVWEDKILWLETKPTGTVKYRAHPDDVQDLVISGSVEEIVLKAYGVYQPRFWGGSSVQDTAYWQGWRKTADQTSANSANLYGGRYRRVGIRIEHTTDATLAAQAVQIALNDRDRPRMRSTIILRRPVLDSAGAPFPLTQVRAGTLIEIPNLRAREAEALGGNDLRDSSTIFLIAQTEYDAEARTLTITPDGARENLVRYMARQQQLMDR